MSRSLKKGPFVDQNLLEKIKKLGEKTFYCIERWNEIDTGELKFNGNPYGGSQDTWVWKGLLRVDSNQYNFKPGTWACDNVMAGMTERFGYQLSNPAYDIITRHVHLQESKSSIYMQVPPGPQKNVPVKPLQSLTN